MKRFNVGIIGATGMVGQRFVQLLENHPWFDVKVLAASSSSAGKTYEQAVSGRWVMETDIPEHIKLMKVKDTIKDKKRIADMVDFIFCAVNMDKKEVKSLEESYAKLECPVISNNSAHRFTVDVPMIIPEINPEHAEVIVSQRKRLGTTKGFIAVKSNCSLQTYVPAVYPLLHLGVQRVWVSTYQAVSGAGRILSTWPEMKDNIIPYIQGEEEKSECEPMKIWGKLVGHRIVNATMPMITAQCFRVPVSDGHMASVFVEFDSDVDIDKIISIWDNYTSEPQRLKLPSAPYKFLHYHYGDDEPQIISSRNLENGMAVSIGRLRRDFDPRLIKFVVMSHNTIRGAAGGAILLAEILCVYGYIDGREVL